MERRAEEDYAEFMNNIAEKYPEAEIMMFFRIISTLKPYGSFYERFELHHTQEKAGWLKMAEIEFSALQKHCHRSEDRRV